MDIELKSIFTKCICGVSLIFDGLQITNELEPGVIILTAHRLTTEDDIEIKGYLYTQDIGEEYNGMIRVEYITTDLVNSKQKNIIAKLLKDKINSFTGNNNEAEGFDRNESSLDVLYKVPSYYSTNENFIAFKDGEVFKPQYQDSISTQGAVNTIDLTPGMLIVKSEANRIVDEQDIILTLITSINPKDNTYKFKKITSDFLSLHIIESILKELNDQVFHFEGLSS